MPAVADVQFDGRLTNVSVQYNNPEMIADLALPPTGVGQKKGKFKKYDKDERFTLPPSLVGPKSEPNELEWSLTEDTFTCLDYGYQEFVNQEEMDNAETPIQPQSDTTEFLTKQLLLDREKRIADVIFATGNYNAANQADIAGNWSTLTYDALADIMTGIDACFAPPNILVMGLPTWRKLQRNNKILDAVKGTIAPRTMKGGTIARPAINQEELAGYLGLDAVLVGRAQINTAKKGQTASYSRVWDGPTATKGGAALLRVARGSALRDVIWGASFDWKTRQTFTFPSTRGAFGGVVIRVVESTVVKVIAKDVGYLFDNVLT